MKTAVFAYQDAGVEGIRVLCGHGFEIVKVYTLPRAPEDSGFESVSAYCKTKGLAVSEIKDPNIALIVSEIRGLSPNTIFSLNFPEIPGRELLSIPSRGTIFLHMSLLPDYQGYNPVVRTLINSERKTGVTLCLLDKEGEPADMIDRAETLIDGRDTVLTLHKKLAAMGAELLERTLPLIREDKVPGSPLSLFEGRRFGPLTEKDARIDWYTRSWEAYNLVRALTRPYPGAWSTFMQEKMIIWRAEPDDATPGLLNAREIDFDDGKTFAGTRAGALRLEEVEWKGRLLKSLEIAAALEPYWREKFE